MTCAITNSNWIRNLFIECQQATLNQFSIPDLYRQEISGVWYLIIPVDATDYTRTITEKSDFIDTANAPFLTPKLARVGFTVRVVNTLWCIRQCLEFLAISSVSTSYSNYIPVTVLDYVRPEITDNQATLRKGLLTLEGGGGTSGVDEYGKPLYTTEYQIVFQELEKRLVM
jgi:hypothetical protein